MIIAIGFDLVFLSTHTYPPRARSKFVKLKPRLNRSWSRHHLLVEAKSTPIIPFVAFCAEVA